MAQLNRTDRMRLGSIWSLRYAKKLCLGTESLSLGFSLRPFDKVAKELSYRLHG